MIYLDHAATSWPKPSGVTEAMVECVEQYGANPGRGSHQMAARASQVIGETRQRLAKMFGIRDPKDIIFTGNTTESLNLALKGFLNEGDHVITSTIEHNSIRRPLEHLSRHGGVEVTYINNEADGRLPMEKLKEAVRSETKLIAISHASNLLGTIQPIQEIGEWIQGTDIKLLVDGAQTAGILPIDVKRYNIHLLAVPGHKGLMGPQGTGALYVDPSIELKPLLHGGTGSFSERVDQPTERPYRYESGTPNTPGIAGWNAALLYIEKVGIDVILKHEKAMIEQLYQGLTTIHKVEVYGPRDIEQRVGSVAFNIKGYDPNEVSMILDLQYGIAVRAGYHCTPLAHSTTGTDGYGAVRVSVGYTTTEKEIHAFLTAIRDMAQSVSDQ